MSFGGKRGQQADSGRPWTGRVASSAGTAQHIHAAPGPGSPTSRGGPRKQRCPVQGAPLPRYAGGGRIRARERVEVKVRDPERIQRILAKLEAIWRESPDLRFGQLLVVLGIESHDPRDHQTTGPCAFYV